MKQEPVFENKADADSKDYYDVSVLIEITAKSLEDGNEVSVFGGGFLERITAAIILKNVACGTE